MLDLEELFNLLQTNKQINYKINININTLQTSRLKDLTAVGTKELLKGSLEHLGSKPNPHHTFHNIRSIKKGDDPQTEV